MKNRRLSALFAVAGLVFSAVTLSNAQPANPGNAPQYVPGEVLVQFNPQATDAELLDAVQRGGLVLQRVIRTRPMQAQGAPGLNVAKVSGPVDQVIRLLRGHPGVQIVEPNWIYQPSLEANDPDLSELWGMGGGYGSQAVAAWGADIIGGSDVVVGIIDTGVDIGHPDLAANIWVNTGETPNNGKDDDNNGYVDDVNGWDFERGDNSVYDGRQDDHGTHVAGTIGAEGNNNRGVVGVNWQVSMIPAKFLGRRGGSTADAIEALDYLTDLKTRHGLNLVAINASWGGGGFSQALQDAIARAGAKNILFVAAAGNGDSLGRAINTDLSPHYPSSYTTPSILSVTAIDSSGAKAGWANYGATSVDLGAPGVGILSTLPNNSYGSYSGTSMATPHVTGAVALYASTLASAASAPSVKSALFAAVEPTGSMADRTVTGGRLDVAKLLGLSANPGSGGNHVPVANDQTVTVGTGQSVDITLTGSDPDGDNLTFAVSSAPTSYGTLSGTAPYLTYDAGTAIGTDTITFTVSDGQSTSAPATVTIRVVSTDLIDMRAELIGLVTEPKGRSLKGTATVKVSEVDSGASVSGATVTGIWSLEGFNDLEVTGTTGTDGTVTFAVSARGGAGEFGFVIVGVAADGYRYAP